MESLNTNNNIPEPGKVYETVIPFRSFAGVTYKKGDLFRLVAPTNSSPFGYQSKITNWLVECKYYSPPSDEAVWSSIYTMIESGFIRAVPANSTRG